MVLFAEIVQAKLENNSTYIPLDGKFQYCIWDGNIYESSKKIMKD